MDSLDNFNLKLKAGNEEAYKSLFTLFYPRMVSYANIFVKDNELARDIAQDTFVCFWEKRKNLQEYPPAEKLLFTILRNNCLKFIRDDKFFQSTVSVDNNHWEEIQHFFRIDFFDPEEEILEDVFLSFLETYINELPAKRKEIFVKCKLHGQSQKQIACELGISLKTVEKHLACAKKQLQELFPDIPIAY